MLPGPFGLGSYGFNMGDKIVRVEIIDKNLMQRNGRYAHHDIDIAMKGVEKGIWKIVSDLYGQPIQSAQEYKTKVMEPAQPEGYLARKEFKALSSRDIYGEKKQK